MCEKKLSMSEILKLKSSFGSLSIEEKSRFRSSSDLKSSCSTKESSFNSLSSKESLSLSE